VPYFTQQVSRTPIDCQAISLPPPADLVSPSRRLSALGMTFQAVQKYERGENRIAASTLYRLARILDVTPGFFFEGYAGPGSETGEATQATKSGPIR
jgi:transcriptional regulator with XRE-family HTH domain